MHAGRTRRSVAPGALSPVPTDHALNVARRNAPNAQRLPESALAATARAPSRTTQRNAMSGGQPCSNPRDDARDRDGREDGSVRVYDDGTRTTTLATPSCATSTCRAVTSANWSWTVTESTSWTAKTAARWPPSARFASCRNMIPRPPHDTLGALHDQRPRRNRRSRRHERGLTLTTEGRDLLDSHLLERDDEPSQTFYAGVSRVREISTTT